MNARGICEICGRSSDVGLASCAHCGVAFPADVPPKPVPDARKALGGEQTPLLFVDTAAFLAEGRLGEIAAGCPRSDVKRVAGTPAEFGRGESLDEAEVWINGPVTFWFDKSFVERIGVYFTLDYLRNDAIAFDADFPKRGDRIDQILDFMERRAIGFDLRDEAVLTSGNVEILWSRVDRIVTSLITPPVATGRRRRG
jgi:hypothetical protein